jgi:excisionase family DNA binding protein
VSDTTTTPEPKPAARRLSVRVKNAAAILDLSPSYIRELVKAGELEGYKIHSGLSHVSMRSIEAWLAKRRVAA